jgi:hypothetical protein
VGDLYTHHPPLLVNVKEHFGTVLARKCGGELVADVEGLRPLGRERVSRETKAPTGIGRENNLLIATYRDAAHFERVSRTHVPVRLESHRPPAFLLIGLGERAITSLGWCGSRSCK